MKTNRVSLSRAVLLVGAVLGMTMLGADCQGNIVNDPTFRDWCGDTLCSWTLDYGNIQRVPTWTEEDYGVSFLDNSAGSPPGTQISQVTQENQATCILFTSVGDIDPNAQMYISVDFDNDGVVDYSTELGATTWHQVQTEIVAPTSYAGITFHITKKGTGTAILAEMRITSVTGCTGAPTMLNPLPMGDGCTSAQQCAKPLVCPAGNSGIEVCSQCVPGTTCPNGAPCDRRSVFLPAQCGPGQGLGIHGDPCLANSDCQSGDCHGAIANPLMSPDAGSCDLNTIGPNDPSNCSWYTAVAGICT